VGGGSSDPGARRSFYQVGERGEKLLIFVGVLVEVRIFRLDVVVNDSGRRIFAGANAAAVRAGASRMIVDAPGEFA
jgi:hypothetical protein